MDRRRFLLTSLVGALEVRIASAQPVFKAPKIGYLSWADPIQDQVFIDALKLGLREQGYVGGRSVAIDYRRGPADQLPHLATQLVQLKVDVMVAVGTPAARAAQQATSSIPIVMTLIADPVDAGLVSSLARPGGNVTGLSMQGVWGKALEVFVTSVPGVSQIAVLMDPTNHGHVLAKKEVDEVAKALGVLTQRIDVQTEADLEAAERGLRRQGIGFYVFPLRNAPILQRIISFALKNRIPALMIRRENVQDGGLMSYTVNFGDQVRRTALYIDRILKGAKAADLPVEQPTKFELVINLKTARALGLTIPQSLLLRADQVIE